MERRGVKLFLYWSEEIKVTNFVTFSDNFLSFFWRHPGIKSMKIVSNQPFYDFWCLALKLHRLPGKKFNKEKK